MAIKINNPSDEYDHIFMSEQSIFQKKFFNVSDTPKYVISLAWKYYKVDPNTGDIVFKPNSSMTYYNDDLYAYSMLLMGETGSTLHFDTLAAQQESIKEIIGRETNFEMEII